MSLEPCAPGELAAIVTALEMRARPPLRPIPPAPLRLVRWQRPAVDAYRTLFTRVGAPWLWFSRLALDEAALTAIVHDPRVQVFAVQDARRIEVGLLELDFRAEAACELAYFGLVPDLAGKGLGRWLMAEALVRAWTREVQRVWVHTCTLDHPAALGFYRAQGFVPFARSIERFADPRLLGLLPRETAPQIPLLAAEVEATR
jgi:GNAT superfamily N-acetyltransferase